MEDAPKAPLQSAMSSARTKSDEAYSAPVRNTMRKSPTRHCTLSRD